MLIEGYFTILMRWGDGRNKTLGIKPDGTVWINGVLTDNGDRIRDALVEFAAATEADQCRYRAVRPKRGKQTIKKNGIIK